MLLSKDCETTGIDIRSGALPYLLTTCNEAGEVVFWEWDVDPLTRKPIVPEEDLREIEAYQVKYSTWIYQNSKFDITAEQAVGIEHPEEFWSRIKDTLIAGHLLASNQPKDLTTLALIYTGINIKPYEDKAEQATHEALKIIKRQFPTWRIAKRGLPEMPSVKEKVWKNDMWTPRAVAKALDYPEDHYFWTSTSDYANMDSSVTLPVYLAQLARLKQRGLLKIYLERLKLLKVVHKMEDYGVTLSGTRLKQLYKEYTEESAKADKECVKIAKELNYELELPKSGTNKSLTNFVFGPLGLEPVKKSAKTGVPSFDKNVMEHYEATLSEGKQLTFVQNLKGKRKRDKGLEALTTYQQYWQPWIPVHITNHKTGAGWYILHPSLNITGTDTLRFSSQNPNSQNISKQEGFNIRYCFGPAPGREWWSLDYSNLELVIPAYDAGETEMINLFERPNDAPYFGSYHMLIFDTLHPEKFAKHGMDSKKVYESTWYQWTKNGDFAVQYGAVEESGTADRAYHVPGAQGRIKGRFSNIAKLNDRMIKHAEKYGYVETMPDKTVDPKHGYPLLCTRSKYGGILATVPLSYRVQGTAMWCTSKAMVRCDNYLEELNSDYEHPRYFMNLQIHDELVFDFPVGKGKEPHKANLSKIERIKGFMEQSGGDIGIPLRATINYHPSNWSEGVKVAA